MVALVLGLCLTMTLLGKGLYPEGCRYVSGKQTGVSCFSHSSLNPNQSQGQDGAEGKTRNKIWEPHSFLFIPIPLRRGTLSLLPEEPLPHTLSSSTSLHPSPPLELLPWLPGMVAKSLHGRVRVGCAATNITMVNQGTPGIGLRGGGGSCGCKQLPRPE